MRVAEQAIDEHHRADGQACRAENLAEIGQLALQRRFLVLERLQHLGDHADLGVHAGGRDEPAPAPVGDHGAHERRVSAVTQRNLLVQHDARVLFHRHRLAGERRFLDLEVHRLHQPKVRRNEIARFEQHDVPGDEFAAGNDNLVPVADHGRVRRGHLLERRKRLLGLGFLDHADDGVQGDDEHDRDRVHVLAQRQRHQRRDHQDDDEVVVELVHQQRQEPGARALVQLVGAVLLQSCLSFALREALLQVRLEVTDELLNGLAVRILVVHVLSPGAVAPVTGLWSAGPAKKI